MYTVVNFASRKRKLFLRGGTIFLVALLFSGLLFSTAGCRVVGDMGGAASAGFQQQNQREERLHEENQIIDEVGKH